MQNGCERKSDIRSINYSISGFGGTRIRPFPFFLRLPSNAFPDVGSVGLKKKKLKKKITRSLEIVGPGTPGRR